VRKDKDGKVDLVNLIGADKLDPGNYKSGVGAMRATFAGAAAEFGDLELRDEMLRQLDEEYHPVFTTSTGALKNKGLSTIEQGAAMRGRMSGFQDWVQMATKGPEPSVQRGPILDVVPFPDVLVAKAYSQDGDSIDLVLYPGKEAGTFPLGFNRLRPGEVYYLGSQQATANKDGTASFVVEVDGRTVLQLMPKRLN
jgi:hypothetical protein